MKISQRPFRTDFYLWNGIAALFFSACKTDPHSHNTMQLVVDLQHGFKYKLINGEWRTCKSLVIRENVIHQLDTNGSVQLLIYLDATSDIAKKIKILYLADRDVTSPNEKILSQINPEDLQRAVLGNKPTQLWELVNRILNFLTQSPKPVTGDKRIYDIIERITITPPGSLSIRHLAETVYLSESRLCALFKNQVGVSLYKYLMWNRIRFGINLLMAGKSVGETALEVGFTDSSHFHKMLIQMFGIGPRAFLKNHRSLQMVTCEEVPIHFETKIFDQYQQLCNTYCNT